MRRRLLSALVSLTTLAAVGLAQPARASAPVDLRALRDQAVAMAGPGSAAWTDTKTGQVVVQTAAPANIKLKSAKLRVEQAAPVQPYALLYGGHGMRSATGKYCTTGFIAHSATASYILTAGHCTANTVYWDRKGDYLGKTYASVFNEDGDYGVITIKGVTFHPRNGVATTEVGIITVEGLGTATAGQSVCKKGNNSGYTCGTVLAVDVSVNYGNGIIVNGLIQTDACAVGGDSGGPLISELINGEPRAWALGVLSGGSGGCTSAEPRTYYNPVGEILDRYGLALGPA